MIEKEKFYAIVIWYFPTSEYVRNINSYIDCVSKLIIIDNSDTNNSSLLDDFDRSKIIYIPNNENKGIASELNRGCRLAIEAGAQWVLTMDQDSCFLDKDLHRFIQSANEYDDFEKVAIFSPSYFDPRCNITKPISEDKYSKINYTMTSGNILSLRVLQKVGFFLDYLFIDRVDEELCIRINQFDLQVVRVNSIFMDHYVGNGTKTIKVFFITKRYNDYAPIRFYYITRNLFIISKLYPKEAKRLRENWKRLVLRMIKYDSRSKIQKIIFVLAGIIDFRLGKTGSYKKMV